MKELTEPSMSQVQVVNEPPPKSWEDYRLGCVSTFRGGHDDPDMSRAFRHGMNTVFNLLEAEFPSAELCQAAPDLLEACKTFLRCHADGEFVQIDKDMLDEARAAIAKATGSDK